MSDLPTIKPIIVRHLGNFKLNDDWLYEFKYDGYRAMLHFDADDAYFMSRDYNRMHQFDGLADSLRQRLRFKRLILDGEITVLNPVTGRPEFWDIRKKDSVLHYVPFDLLYLNRQQWWRRPFEERKCRLATLIKNQDGLVVSEFWEGKPEDIVKYVHKNNLEGIVIKRRSDAYQQGSTRWYKLLNPEYRRKEDVSQSVRPKVRETKPGRTKGK